MVLTHSFQFPQGRPEKEIVSLLIFSRFYPKGTTSLDGIYPQLGWLPVTDISGWLHWPKVSRFPLSAFPLRFVAAMELQMHTKVEYTDGSENTRVLFVSAIRNNGYVMLASRAFGSNVSGWLTT